ncbi:Mycothiol maleylpyruvate isomerase N-terminal domain [Nocardia otitidiscaviarum]|uniref:Mycothiol maleylpyruvate isomerase N-terminal domain n=1 Tax=Nocardia otitidiscaviarum TaxID=1823 RepID=A0A378Y7X5_9NOCA|nr:TIGR03086 family metal-binding protein [Nocardia otitidiscaviarum]SUA73184.1 Mycothiol maleylpyruvate isomerase N-terminal domain [Nocardia otitidiscaviarum]
MTDLNTAALAPVWRDVLATSYAALTDVVAGIGDDQWQLPTPCSEWTVTQVIQHAAGDQLAYAAALGIGAGPASDPFAPSGTLDGAAADLVRAAVDETAAAWATVTDDTETVPTPLPHGALPTPVAAVMCALDAAVHAWDIAVATGQPNPLDDELAGHLLVAARGLVEPLRQWGAYADIVQTGDSATPVVDELLGYLGRDPRS